MLPFENTLISQKKDNFILESFVQEFHHSIFPFH